MRMPVRTFIVVTGMLTLIAFGAEADAAKRQAKIVNGARAAVISLQIKDSDRKGPWRANLLAREPLGVKKEMKIDLPDKKNCFFDVTATFEDGRRFFRAHVNLCRLETFTLTDF